MPEKKGSLKDKIHAEVLNGIMQGDFPLDQFLSEGELASRYGVSKGPVREALVELCHENVLRSIPRLGYQIVQLTERNIREATELRVLLETDGLSKTANAMSDRDVAQLSALNRECTRKWEEGKLTIEEHWALNIRFHLMLNATAGNSHVNRVLEEALKLIWRAYVQLYSEADHDAYIANDLKRHMEIEQAIRDKNQSKAVELLQQDILFIRGQLFRG